jgi:hypothetical protein
MIGSRGGSARNRLPDLSLGTQARRRVLKVNRPGICLPAAVSNAISYANFFSRSHDAVIRVYDEAGNVIAAHEQSGESKH